MTTPKLKPGVRYKKVHIGFRAPPQVRLALEEVAAANNAYISDVILLFLKQRLIAEGFMEDDNDGRRAPRIQQEHGSTEERVDPS